MSFPTIFEGPRRLPGSGDLSQQGMKHAAMLYNQAGFSVIPIGREAKAPLSLWEQYMFRRQSLRAVGREFPDIGVNIAVLCGTPSGNLLVLDFDNFELYEQARSDSAAFRSITENTLIVRSTRGMHVYLLTPIPVATKKRQRYDLDIKGEGGYVVAPPSVHSSGHHYHFVDHTKSIYRLRDLEELAVFGLEPASFKPIPQYGTGNLRRAITGSPLGYHSRSEAEQALIVHQVANGWEKTEVLEAFNNNASRKSKYYERGAYGPARLSRDYENALKHVRSTPRSEVDRNLDSLAATIDRIPGSGQKRDTDQAVFQAVLLIARRSGKLSGIALSSRELAEQSGRSAATVSRSVRRLCELGLLKLDTGSDGRVPAIYSLPPMKHSNTENNIGNPVDGVFQSRQTQRLHSHDAFRRGALNKSGIRVVRLLNDTVGKSHSVSEIAAAVGSARSTVDRVLKRLLGAGLLIRTEYGRRVRYYSERRIEDSDLEMVAQRCGTNGTSERQARRHRQERFAHAWYREQAWIAHEHGNARSHHRREPAVTDLDSQPLASGS